MHTLNGLHFAVVLGVYLHANTTLSPTQNTCQATLHTHTCLIIRVAHAMGVLYSAHSRQQDRGCLTHQRRVLLKGESSWFSIYTLFRWSASNDVMNFLYYTHSVGYYDSVETHGSLSENVYMYMCIGMVVVYMCNAELTTLLQTLLLYNKVWTLQLCNVCVCAIGRGGGGGRMCFIHREVTVSSSPGTNHRCSHTLILHAKSQADIVLFCIALGSLLV